MIMLYLDKNGQFQDTHPDYDEQVAEYGNQIIEKVEEEYIDSCRVVEEWDDFRSWAVVEDSDNLDELIEDNIEYFTKDDNLGKQMLEDIEEYVRQNIDQDNLNDIAIENYGD